MEKDEVKLIIELQKQTHSCVKSLQREVQRNSAMTVSNGLKNGTVIANCQPCRQSVSELELWKAGHTGEATGKAHKASRFDSKTTLICVIGVALLTLLGFWFTVIQPMINVNAEMLSEFKSINGQHSELDISE